MRFKTPIIAFLLPALLSLILSSPHVLAQTSDPTKAPALIAGQGNQLARVKAGIEAGNPELVAALKKIVKDADAALKKPTTNVVDEGAMPPSGDPHDYYSYSPYWWPDPEKPDGLPYIWRDGQINPDRHTSDVSRIESMTDAVTSLVPAWYFTGDDRYAEKAVQQLRAWFLDPATKMNPNIRFGQKRRGHDYNSHSGVIEALRMRWVVDCAILLESYPGWTEKDARNLRKWFGEFSTWMVESFEGREEAMQPNNHGTWYNYQLILFSIYGEKPDIARSHLELMPTRIFGQVFMDGRQPQELIRTNALDYSIYNARGLVGVARLGQHLDIDLFAFRSTEGRCIRLALDYLTPFILGDEEWPGMQVRPIKKSGATQLYWAAAIGFQDREFAKILRKLPGDGLPSPIVQLLDPLPEAW
ncbi:alginate lyase family protein [Haloferula sp.]|uniref:alginate lyase family protein n=1 Tax=Haloferula sp. TaxID=2497595 RepID=UPI00329D92B2